MIAAISEYHQRMVDTAEHIGSAFRKAGVELDLRSEDRRSLYWLARWLNGVNNDELQFQDPTSRKLVEAVERKAAELLLALGAAYEHSGLEAHRLGLDSLPSEQSDKINVCETLFEEDSEQTMCWDVIAIQLFAAQCLGRGRIARGKGRPPLLSYYAFVRDLHSIYESRTRAKGFYEKNGTAEGPFVDLVEEVQKILPSHMRLKERTTIGNRVLAAFTVEIPK